METDKLVELYKEVDLLQHQIQDAESQLNEISKQEEEVKNSLNALKEIKEHKPDEVLIPVVNGVFARAKLLDADKFIVSVGSNVLIGKSIDDSIKLFEENVSELSGYRKKLEQTYTHLLNDFQVKQGQLAQMSSQVNSLNLNKGD